MTVAGFCDMPDQSAEPDKPTYEELAALVAQQRKAIVTFHETIKQQAALIEELQEAARLGKRWKPKGRTGASGAMPEGLGVRTEAILKLAEAEAEELREQAKRAAAEYIAAAERDAARIRAEAAGSGDPQP